MEVTALGMIETVGLVSAIEAADAGLKAADVRLLGTDYVRGGLVMVPAPDETGIVSSHEHRPAARRRGPAFVSNYVVTEEDRWSS